jgi:hypothetical protein
MPFPALVALAAVLAGFGIGSLLTPLLLLHYDRKTSVAGKQVVEKISQRPSCASSLLFFARSARFCCPASASKAGRAQCKPVRLEPRNPPLRIRS